MQIYMQKIKNLGIDDKIFEKFELFTSLLLKYNKIHNVSGVKTKKEIYKNIYDSIYPLKFLDFKSIKKAIDIGSGAGFPGLLLAIALSEVSFVLYEPILKKSAFLHLIKSKLELKNVIVLSCRVEKSEPFDVDLITSRALSSAKILISLVAKFIKKDTKLLLYKGDKVEKELEQIKNYDIIQNEKRYYLLIKEINV